MKTAFQQLADAMVAALKVAPALAGGRIYKNRQRPIAAADSSAVVVRFKNASGREECLGVTDWQSEFSVDCFGRAVPTADPTDVADALLADVWARLATLDAAALGAMAVTVNTQIEWDEAEGEAPTACATFNVSVIHRTAVASLAPLL